MSVDPRIRWQRTVARAEDLPRSTRHIAVLLAAHLNAQLVGGVALAALMLETGYSKPTVLRATKRLRADGWLRVVTPHRRNRATVYQADVPALFARDEVSEQAPEPANQVSPATPDWRSEPVDRPFEVSPLTPDRPLVVSPLTPNPAVEVSPATPLFKGKGKGPLEPPVEEDGGASRPPASAGDVELVMAALCPEMRPRTEAEASSYRHLIRQRLDHRTVLELVTAAAAVRPRASSPVTNPPALFAARVPVVPAALVAAAPRPRCTRYGHEHAVVTADGCAACRVDDHLAASS